LSGIFRIRFPYGDIGIFWWIDRILDWRGIGLGRCPELGMVKAVFVKMHEIQMLRNRQGQPLILVIMTTSSRRTGCDDAICTPARRLESIVRAARPATTAAKPAIPKVIKPAFSTLQAGTQFLPLKVSCRHSTRVGGKAGDQVDTVDLDRVALHF